MLGDKTYQGWLLRAGEGQISEFLISFERLLMQVFW
jgi:hypothetical protein